MDAYSNSQLCRADLRSNTSLQEADQKQSRLLSLPMEIRLLILEELLFFADLDFSADNRLDLRFEADMLPTSVLQTSQRLYSDGCTLTLDMRESRITTHHLDAHTSLNHWEEKYAFLRSRSMRAFWTRYDPGFTRIRLWLSRCPRMTLRLGISRITTTHEEAVRCAKSLEKLLKDTEAMCLEGRPGGRFVEIKLSGDQIRQLQILARETSVMRLLIDTNPKATEQSSDIEGSIAYESVGKGLAELFDDS